jgi:hypothetical protein
VTDPAGSTPRAWLSCALVVLGAAVLVVGLLMLDSEPGGSLAIVVGPAVALVAAGAALTPRVRGS